MGDFLPMNKRDYVKIARAKDQKLLNEEKQRVEHLQQNGLYPEQYTFPLTLQFELTTHCNVRCKHCYNNSGVCNAEPDRMGPTEWKKFAQYLVDRGGIFQCVISGGEPLLLGDDLFEIMDVLHKDGTVFLLITNGYLLTQEKIRRLGNYSYKWLQVSIDGANAGWHDEFRQRSGSWERAVRGAYMVSKEGIPLTIAHSVCRGNLYQLDEMCKLAYELGAGSIILGEITPSGRSANHLELTLTYEEKNYLYQKIQELSAQYAGKMNIQRSSSTRNQLLRYVNMPNSGAIIRPNGDIRLDCMAPFVLGNVLDEDFEAVWLTKAADCWKDERVLRYIAGYSSETDINMEYKNYFDEDIRL